MQPGVGRNTWPWLPNEDSARSPAHAGLSADPMAFWLMAATDGHAKNCSIFLQPGDSYVMTPLYDVLSMWPYFGKGRNQFNRKRAGLAMAKRSKTPLRVRHDPYPALAPVGDEEWRAGGVGCDARAGRTVGARVDRSRKKIAQELSWSIMRGHFKRTEERSRKVPLRAAKLVNRDGVMRCSDRVLRPTSPPS